MKNCRSIIFLFSFIVSSVSCIPRRKKGDTTQKLHRTGETNALDNLIQKYEKAHQKFYEREMKDGKHLEWPALDSKNLSDYCTNYIHNFVPTKSTNSIGGTKTTRKLLYEKHNESTIIEVVVVCCKIMYKGDSLVYYYMTKAPEQNCVYALKCTGNCTAFIFTIINKYCDFEDDLSTNKSRKRRREEVSSFVHRTSSQPIAKDKYLMEYELEHQELLKREGEEGKRIEWSHAMDHPNLDLYCQQYIRECAPRRNRENVTGYWKTEKLHYQKVHTREDIDVTTVTCKQKYGSQRRYHMTRALEINCVYALLQMNSKVRLPLVIIFKHCDFEDSNNHQIISQNYDITENNVIIEPKIKEESVNALKTLQLFPKH